jgi:hypothetical protein
MLRTATLKSGGDGVHFWELASALELPLAEHAKLCRNALPGPWLSKLDPLPAQILNCAQLPAFP